MVGSYDYFPIAVDAGIRRSLAGACFLAGALTDSTVWKDKIIKMTMDAHAAAETAKCKMPTGTGKAISTKSAPTATCAINNKNVMIDALNSDEMYRLVRHVSIKV